uniref:Uncharacterized protein n=1 Tax=Anas zonorhyncha TaxID=75864 RepID=A0A8B9VN34_9AVES
MGEAQPTVCVKHILYRDGWMTPQCACQALAFIGLLSKTFKAVHFSPVILLPSKPLLFLPGKS